MATTQRQRRTLRVLVVVVVLLALLGGCGMWLTRDTGPREGVLGVVHTLGSANAASPSGHDPFATVAHIEELRPGVPRTMQVRVTNPDRQPYRILRLTAVPQDASAACPAKGNVTVTSYDAGAPGATAYVIPPKSSITMPLTITLNNSDISQDACKNVTFPLVFGGLATQGEGSSTS